MLVWRYSGHLMGVPDELLFDSEESALKLHAVGAAARRKLTAKIYKISRALIGDEMADALNYPPSNTVGVLGLLRWRNRLDAMMQSSLPGMAHRRRAGRFQQMLDISHYESLGIGYRMPARVHAETEGWGSGDFAIIL